MRRRSRHALEERERLIVDRSIVAVDPEPHRLAPAREVHLDHALPRQRVEERVGIPAAVARVDREVREIEQRAGAAGLEAAFRGLKRRVRNRALADLGTAGRRDHVEDALADALERLIVLAHHTLRLMGREVPAEEPALIGAFATVADADPKALIHMRDAIRAGRPLSDPMASVGATLAFVERGAALLDTLEAR